MYEDYETFTQNSESTKMKELRKQSRTKKWLTGNALENKLGMDEVHIWRSEHG